MKKLDKYNRIAGYLDKIYNLLNETYFEGQLPKAVITIQKSTGKHGYFTTDTVWSTDEMNFHEININPETITRPISEVSAILLHEMIHYFCYIHGIHDVSRNGTYHNGRFHDQAIIRDLTLIEDEKIGWRTATSEKLIEFCTSNNLKDIPLGREIPEKTSSRATTHSRKYVCPCCGDSARTTKDKRLICGDCKEIMKLAI